MPFAVWVVAGAILLSAVGNDEIFTFINGAHSPILDTTMYFTTMLGEGVTITAVLLLLLAVASLRNWWYFTAAVLCNVLPSLITQIMKRRIGAPRPLKYFAEAEWVHTLPHWPRHFEHSFPSGHTCGAFAFFAFLSMLLPVRYRHWALVFFILAILTGYSRIYLAVHFFRDVYAGSIIGTVCAVVIIALMNRYAGVFVKK